MSLDAGAAVLDVQGNLSGLRSALEGEGASLFAKFGEHAGGILAAAFPVAIGVGLFKIGETFDEQFDKIRVGTGKTGKALDGLEESFKNVAKGVPNSFDDIGSAIEGINVKLGDTGKPLEALATQVLNLSRVTKTDLAGNVELVTGLFNNWNVAAKDQTLRLDELFRAHQLTGVAVADLAGQMSKGGAVLRTLGFSYEQGAALVGLLSKNGLDATPILAGFSKSIATMAKAGETFPDTFRRIIGEIHDAKDPVAATSEAVALFGARSGPKLAELIRSGKLSVEELAASIAGGKDTINSAADDTLHFSEQWKIFSHRLLVDVEPVAVAVFHAVGDAMGALGPVFDQLEGWAHDIASAWDDVVAGFDNPDAKIGSKVGQVERIFLTVGSVLHKAFDGLRDVFSTVADALSPITDAIGDFFAKNPAAGFAGLAGIVGGIVLAAVVALAAALWGLVAPAIAAAAPFVLIGLALFAVGFAVYYAWTHFSIFREAIAAVAAFITGIIWPAIKAFASGVAEQFGHLVDWTKKHWAAISEAISHVWVVIQTVVKIGLGALLLLWNTFGSSIVSVVKAAWQYVTATISAAVSVIENLFAFFIDIINGDWGKAWGDLLGVVQGVWDGVFALVNFAFGFLSAIFGGALNAIGVAWDAAWSAMGSVVSSIWGLITGVVSGGINGIWAVITFVGGAITSAWSAVWNGFTGIVEGVIGGVEGAAKSLINGVIGILNAGIGFINSHLQIHVGIDDPTGITDGIHFDYNGPHIPKIPTLHQGGIYRAPNGIEGLALLRDREVVTTPEDDARASRGPAVHIERMYAWNARDAAAEIERERVWGELAS